MSSRPRIPAAIWALGGVSLLMDTSSELIHSLLPVFLVVTLGTSVAMVGLIEGIAEATAAVAKVFSGVLSDRLRRRKGLTVLGYGLAAAVKPLFPLAGSATTVLVARFLDRVGKGIRGAPRDALVADLTPPAVRGAAYGLRQALDTVGAIAGPALALLLMVWFAGDVRTVLSFAVVPAVLAVLVLVLLVREPEREWAAHEPPAPWPLRRAALRRLPRLYWAVLGLASLLTLARFSEAFLVLRAENLGLPMSRAPLVMVVMNLAYAASAYPAGLIADRHSRPRLLAAGLLVLIAADLVLAAATNPGLLMGGAALWGLHMGLTQGLLATLIADAAPTDLRGTAFGFFHLATGVATFLASVLAGGLWSLFGAPATFLAGAALTALALPGLLRFARPA
ncbi:MAG TPA: MFS transporter [Candidatus Acidoferrales bacterium]|nr:MFS transporter [Candidatus Acidoferrales bacterium]